MFFLPRVFLFTLTWSRLADQNLIEIPIRRCTLHCRRITSCRKNRSIDRSRLLEPESLHSLKAGDAWFICWKRGVACSRKWYTRNNVCVCACMRARALHDILSGASYVEIKFKINSELFAPLIERYPVTRLDLRRSWELELILLETKCERWNTDVPGGRYGHGSSSGYLSEPEPRAYSDRSVTLDSRRRLRNKENDFTTATMPKKWARISRLPPEAF